MPIDVIALHRVPPRFEGIVINSRSYGGIASPVGVAARAPATRRLLLVADVDGTLLDSSGRMPLRPAAFRECLTQLAAVHGAECDLVLASSRTLRELLLLQRCLGIAGACIAEDGAIVAMDEARVPADAPPPSYISQAGRRRLHVWQAGTSAAALRATIDPAVVKHELDPGDREAMRSLGFRTLGAIRRALIMRNASVLLDLRAVGDGEVARLRAITRSTDARLQRGGRWHTLTRNAGKGAAVRSLRQLCQRDANTALAVVAIGNEENDACMLAAADVRFAIRNPSSGIHPALAMIDRIVPLQREGTKGFNEMLERLLTIDLFIGRLS